MAGYLFNLDSLDSLELYTRNGVYATKLPSPSGYWRVPQEGTFADYATMKKGDNVYFFIKRKIYGIGELVNVGNNCKYCNFPEASRPVSVNYLDVKDKLLWDEGEISKDQRWICIFKPSPYFFCDGVDMDDVLSSNPAAFKMLRGFWRLSFIKFDEEENQAFKDVILKFNQDLLSGEANGENTFESDYGKVHKEICNKIKTGKYELDVVPILSYEARQGRVKHEMALEAGFLFQLANKDKKMEEVFGRWDYLSHQVIASPFKPIDYMDKMDVFGYSYVIGYEPTKSHFLVAELKTGEASKEDVEQLMKYVDWVQKEYCFGDYSMINAFLVAYEFGHGVLEHKSNAAIRKYTIGMRPARSQEWNKLKLVRYRFNPSDFNLAFEVLV